MSNKLIEMRKIKRLYNLHNQGISLRQISIQLGISRTTIKKARKTRAKEDERKKRTNEERTQSQTD